MSVLTAHASKGLEWDLVCVAGVQEGLWPSSRLRGSFLGTERLVDLLRPDAESLPADVAAVTTLTRLLAEERRLFYVAVTRARRRLLVTAVTSEREGLSPSRFLDEIDPLPDGPGDDATRQVTTVARPLSLAGLVSELRRTVSAGPRTVADPDGDERRRGAAAQLARLAAAGARGADPDSWWGLAPLSDERSVRDDGDEVRVSPSKVEMFTRCELRWFLENVGGTEATSTQQNVGTLVHAVAESALNDATSTEEALLAKLDALLPGAELGSGWVAEKEQARATAMVAKLARWLAANRREVVGTELTFRTSVGRAILNGRVDRLERDDQGRGVRRRPQDRLTGGGQGRRSPARPAGRLPARGRVGGVRRPGADRERRGGPAASRQGRDQGRPRADAKNPCPAIPIPTGRASWSPTRQRAWPAPRSRRSTTTCASGARCAPAVRCRTTAGW